MNSHSGLTHSPARRLALGTLLIAATALGAAAPAFAQVAPPTPKSVAPAYKPPQAAAPDYSVTQQHQYVAPHAGTWDFYLNFGVWFFNDTNMNASHVFWERGDRHTPDVYASGKLKMKMDNEFAFGFGAGYNILENLSVHALFSYSSPDYTATFTGTRLDDGRDIDGTAHGEADISTGELSIRYDLLQGKWRPYVQASIGFMYIDTGIVDGYWWNWYWGDYSTVDHTYLTLGATAGMSYSFTKNFFGRLSYTANWANTPHDWMLTQRVDLAIGWNY